MSNDRPSYRERVAQDADDITGFFSTRAGMWTAIGLGLAVIVCSAIGLIDTWVTLS